SIRILARNERAPLWSSSEVPPTPFSTPNWVVCERFTAASSGIGGGQLGGLNRFVVVVSARSLRRSMKVEYFASTAWKTFEVGPVMARREAVPNLPGGGALNAEVSNQRVVVRCDEGRLGSRN